jgi:hypothetical protein
MNDRNITRRSLLRRGLLASGAVTGSRLLAARAALGQQIPPWPSGLPPALVGSSALYLDRLPSSQQLYADVKQMVGFGPRLTGTPAHNAFIDWIEEGLLGAGCRMLARDQFAFTRWLADRWSLQILDGPAPGRVPIASYAPYSGNTPSGGVSGKLAYLGTVPELGLPSNPQDLLSLEAALSRAKRAVLDWATAALAGIPGGAAGRIVLFDTQTPPALSEDDLLPLVTYTYDPDRPVTATADYKRMWIGNAVLPQLLTALASAGAAGAALILDGSAAATAGQYLPYGNPVAGVPALLVDRDTGDRLRRISETTPTARLTLTASTTAVTSPQLVGILPGDGSTDELIVVNTHTDGMNAFEENGGIGLVWLARYFSSLPPQVRLKRTLVFSAVMGHFSPIAATAQTLGFIDRHPDLVKRAVASLTLEHFGCGEWLDDARGYYPTGRPEGLAIWHSQTPIALPLVDSIVANDLRHATALRPAGGYMIAVGGPLHTAGVPTTSFIAGPDYLVSWADNGHLEKFVPDRAAREVRWAADFLTRLDGLPAAQLAAGDSALLSLTRGTPLAGNPYL